MGVRPYRHNLRGQRFGKLVALEPTEQRLHGKVMWECKCDCGNLCIVMSTRLVQGHTRSCGCYSSECIAARNTTHGGSHSRLYSIWESMKTRCNNPKASAYSYYGGKGVKVCIEWERDFAAFRRWALENGYRSDLTLDRIDGNKGYSPENCRWATWHEQRVNQNRGRREDV